MFELAELMLASADKLAKSGADFLICPDNTIHQALPNVLPRSPLPWLHIAEVVAAEASARGFKRIGIAGTRWLVDSEVYPEKLSERGLEYLRPTDAERDDTNRIIMDELVMGIFRPEAIATSSTSVGLMRLPADLIIASSRPLKRIKPSSPFTTVSPDHTAPPRNRCPVIC